MGIKVGEKGIVQLLSKTRDFKNTNANDIQEWFFKKKAIILAFKLQESEKNKDINCQDGDGVFWFKSEKKYKLFEENKPILFCYDGHIIASARLKDNPTPEEPVILHSNKKEERYNGYFIISNIVIFKNIIDEDSINKNFKKSDGSPILLNLQDYAYIHCKQDFDIGEEISQEVINKAKELSKEDKWKSLKDAPEWFKNIDEFCKF